MQGVASGTPVPVTGTITAVTTLGTVTNPVGIKGADGSTIAGNGNPVPTNVISALPAGANGIGNVGGKTTQVCLAPSVTATNAYGTNYVVGGLLNFTGLLTSTGSGVLQTIMIDLKKVETSGFTLTLFSQNPSNSTWTDAAAANINAADVGYVRSVIPLQANSQLGTMTNLSATGLGIAIAPGTTNLYGILTANAALTNQFGATTDMPAVCVYVLNDL
jgi:hypothetical protein